MNKDFLKNKVRKLFEVPSYNILYAQYTVGRLWYDAVQTGTHN